jgi:hypothetical protein
LHQIEKHKAIANLLKKFVNTEEQWAEKAKAIQDILNQPAPAAPPKVKTRDEPEKPPESRNRREKGGTVRGDSE